MKKLIAVVGFTMLLVTAMSAWAEDGSWAIKADYTESCSCSVPCPCSFGSPATRGHCDASGLIEISEGHNGDVNLDGIKVAVSARLGSWAKFYVSENATDAQVDAAVALVRNVEVFGDYYPESLENVTVEKAPINVERSGDNIKFSTPFSNVSIDMMRGLNGDPVHITNLPMRALIGHTQYKSSINSHKSTDREFTYEGTNALTSIVEASSAN